VTELLIDVDQTPIGISPVGDYTISKY